MPSRTSKLATTLRRWSKPDYRGSLSLPDTGNKQMTDDTKPQMGFTSPLFRAVEPWALPEPPKQRCAIGFIHFGEPEPDPAVCVAAYVKLAMEGKLRGEPELRGEDEPELPF